MGASVGYHPTSTLPIARDLSDLSQLWMPSISASEMNLQCIVATREKRWAGIWEGIVGWRWSKQCRRPKISFSYPIFLILVPENSHHHPEPIQEVGGAVML